MVLPKFLILVGLLELAEAGRVGGSWQAFFDPPQSDLRLQLARARAEGRRGHRQTGGIYTAADFVLLGQHVATGAVASQSFEEFKRSRKGL
jgi:hypothetical protein